MTNQDREFLDRITEYANDVCADIDPQKTQISVQLDRLMPIIKTIAEETKESPENVFIKYMDLASELAAKAEVNFQEDMKVEF